MSFLVRAIRTGFVMSFLTLSSRYNWDILLGPPVWHVWHFDYACIPLLEVFSALIGYVITGFVAKISDKPRLKCMQKRLRTRS
jgi:hypothetical protein